MTGFGSGAGGDGTLNHAVNLNTFNGENWTYNLNCTNSNPGGLTPANTPVTIAAKPERRYLRPDAGSDYEATLRLVHCRLATSAFNSAL